MALKRFQEKVLRTTSKFLEALAAEYKAGNRRFAGPGAWEGIGKGIYQPRKTGVGADLPHFCLKVPTGGGKTLLATQVLAQVYKTLLPERNGAGLVLWVVPSDQIYRDVLKALRDRRHFYRESLEMALSRRIEVWEKHEIVRLTPTQLATNLNVLILKLQGTNRNDKESLKFFRDSGGNITLHFPPEDDPLAHRELLERTPNLDMFVADNERGEYLAKTSLANLVRLCEPVVVLDETHRAVSNLAQQTLSGFNPRLIIELSATPPQGANVLCRVSGKELLDEEMIKLPINVANAAAGSWQNCLTQARDRREQLAKCANQYYGDGGPLIRPIVLVQVERVGRDQRSADYIHAEDVREYLVQRLGVASDRVRVKTSVQNDIEGIDLLADDCPVEWIITKSALQEGWDCPFAYILVSLNNSQSQTAVTQLVGRILRQPFVQKTPHEALNESYVYCLHRHPAEIIREIRSALTQEGYEGDAVSVRDLSESARDSSAKVSHMRPQIKKLYQTGTIYLPFFGLQEGRQRERLDYYAHLLSRVDLGAFDYPAVAKWDLKAELEAAREQFYRVELNDDALEPINIRQLARDHTESDAAAMAWLVANLDMEWFSARQLRFLVQHMVAQLPALESHISLVRFGLLTRMRAFIEAETDRQTEAHFDQLFEQGKIIFGMEKKELVYEVPQERPYRAERALRRHDDSPLQRNLFDPYPDDDNGFEREVALTFDDHPHVKWWLRNVPDASGYFIQGPRRSRIYPDYVLSRGSDGNSLPAVLVIESKGTHLSGNADTAYKRRVGKYFESIGKVVPWQEVTWREPGNGFNKHCFQFHLLDQGNYSGEEWRDELARILNNGVTERR